MINIRYIETITLHHEVRLPQRHTFFEVSSEQNILHTSPLWVSSGVSEYIITNRRYYYDSTWLYWNKILLASNMKLLHAAQTILLILIRYFSMNIVNKIILLWYSLIGAIVSFWIKWFVWHVRWLITALNLRVRQARKKKFKTSFHPVVAHKTHIMWVGICKSNEGQWPLLLAWFNFNPSMDK